MGAKYHKLRTVTRLRVALWVVLFYALAAPALHGYRSEGYNRYVIYLDDEAVGTVGSEAEADSLYRRARVGLRGEDGEALSVVPPAIRVDGEEVLTGTIDAPADVAAAMQEHMRRSASAIHESACQIKVNGALVSVSDLEAAQALLQSAIDEYDLRHEYELHLVKDSRRELNVLIPEVVPRTQSETQDAPLLPQAGAAAHMESLEAPTEEEVGFDSFRYGIADISFSEAVEVTEAWLSEDELMEAGEALSRLTRLQEEQQIYTIQAGDTLSEIALTVGLPLDEIIARNDALENENSIIHPDQELIITVPEPELSVIWSETVRYDEIYDLPTEYIYNDEWYTNKSVTLTQPSAGYRDAVISITRKNDREVARETLYEIVSMQAVAKVVEVGTITPPSYIKPISGGRISSGFGSRSRPTRGASSYHQGVDLATPIGTSVYASSGGVVAFAGWGAGYGNVVYINHPDGRQTRYGHLSRIYVSAGQSVQQGQLIAASGNTGVSTGPHLHFEMRINGVAVDPRNYVNLY